MTVLDEDGSVTCVCHEHRSECDCVIAFAPEPLSAAQLNFLTLHATRTPDRWQWHFLSSALRAHSGRRTATIWRDDLEDLVERGFLRWGLGVSVECTEAGRAACKVEKERTSAE